MEQVTDKQIAEILRMQRDQMKRLLAVNEVELALEKAKVKALVKALREIHKSRYGNVFKDGIDEILKAVDPTGS